MHIGSFGNVVFEVSSSRVLTPQSISRERKGSYAEHKVLAALPRLEFLAPELMAMSMSIRLLASLGVDPLWDADKIGVYAKDGTAARLIILGVNCGTMILESYAQTWRHVVADKIHSIDMQLQFKEYV